MIRLSEDERAEHAKAIYKVMQQPLAQQAANVLVTNFGLIFGVERDLDAVEAKMIGEAVSQFMLTIGMMARLDALGIDERLARLDKRERAAQIEQRAQRLGPEITPIEVPPIGDGEAP